jgi:hypothetical protein
MELTYLLNWGQACNSAANENLPTSHLVNEWSGLDTGPGKVNQHWFICFLGNFLFGEIAEPQKAMEVPRAITQRREPGREGIQYRKREADSCHRVGTLKPNTVCLKPRKHNAKIHLLLAPINSPSRTGRVNLNWAGSPLQRIPD